MNFLSIDDLSKDQIKEIFLLADEIRKGKEEMSLRVGHVAVLLFEKPSTRTRVSFEAAIAQLGGHYIDVDSRSSQISRGESWADTAKVLSLYADMIIARLNTHESLVELANNSSVPVINALTDLEHPTQALSDIYTVQEVKRRLNGIKFAFIGDIASNTANSLLLCATRMGMEVSLVGPKNYSPNSKYLTKAREYGIVRVSSSIQEGLADADVVYTDTFVSMGEEAEAEERRKLFAPYQLNSQGMSYAKGDAVVMHCLPAHRGEEITSEVIDGKQSIVFKQAKNKLLMEKAIILYMAGVKKV